MVCLLANRKRRTLVTLAKRDKGKNKHIQTMWMNVALPNGAFA
jgi:hypothetical protein